MDFDDVDRALVRTSTTRSSRWTESDPEMANFHCGFGILKQTFICCRKKGTQYPDKEAGYRGEDDDKSPLGKRALVWWNGGIDDLNHRAFSCLVKLRHLELPRQNIEDGFAVLNIAKFSEVLKTRFRNAPFVYDESVIALCALQLR